MSCFIFETKLQRMDSNICEGTEIEFTTSIFDVPIIAYKAVIAVGLCPTALTLCRFVSYDFIGEVNNRPNLYGHLHIFVFQI